MSSSRSMPISCPAQPTPGFHKLTREYALRRKDPRQAEPLYVIESTPTTTGMKAEHRLGLRASEIPAFAAALAAAVGASGVQASSYSWTAEQQKFLAALAKDLKANAGKSAVHSGPLSGRVGYFDCWLRINNCPGQCRQDGYRCKRAAQCRFPATRSAISRRWSPI